MEAKKRAQEEERRKKEQERKMAEEARRKAEAAVCVMCAGASPVFSLSLPPYMYVSVCVFVCACSTMLSKHVITIHVANTFLPPG